MTEFNYQLSRIEYHIESVEVDQYDVVDPGGKTITHGVYPDYQSAVDDLDKFTVMKGNRYGRAPKDASHDYWRSGISEKKIPIVTGDIANVALVAMGTRKPEEKA